MAGGRLVKPARFVATVTEVIVHHAIEVSPDLLMWMDLGGTRESSRGPNGEDPIDDTDHERAFAILQRLIAIDGVESSSVEYNGHYGPYVYFACEQSKAEKACAAACAIVADCNRRMLRTKAHRTMVAWRDARKALVTPEAPPC